VIRAEKRSGGERAGRSELQLLLDFLRKGDVLVVTRIDRLARSVKDLQDIVHELKAKGVTLKATDQPIDTGSAAGKAFLDMLGVFAEFETSLRRERYVERFRPPRLWNLQWPVGADQQAFLLKRCSGRFEGWSEIGDGLAAIQAGFGAEFDGFGEARDAREAEGAGGAAQAVRLALHVISIDGWRSYAGTAFGHTVDATRQELAEHVHGRFGG